MDGRSESPFEKAVDLIGKGDAASLEKALEMLLEIKDDTIKLNVNRRLGIIYLEMMNYEKAFEEYSKVISDLEKGLNFKANIDKEHKIDDKLVTDEKIYIKILRAWTHHDLAVVLVCKKEYLTAEEHFNKAIDLVKEINDVSTEAWFRNDLGWLFHEKCNYDKAIEQYKIVLKLNIKNKFSSYPYFFLGLASYRKGFKHNAREYFKKSKDIIENDIRSFSENEHIQYDLLIAHILIDTARIDLDEKKRDDAKKNLDLALSIYTKHENDIENNYSPRRKAVENENIAITYCLLGRFYFEQEKMDDANNKFEEADKKSDSISNKAKYYNNVGCIYLKKGELSKASDNFLSAISKDASSKDAIENIKLINAAKEKVLDFFTFWFDLSQGKLKGSIKSILAVFLILITIMNIIIIMAPSTTITVPYIGSISGIYNNESTTELNYNYSKEDNGVKFLENPATKKVTEKRTPNLEQRLILIGLSIFILLMPWIKSFSAGTVKIELKDTTPLIITGGAGASPGSPQIQA